MLHKNKKPKKPKGEKPDTPRNRTNGRWEGAGASRRQLMGLFPPTLRNPQRRWLAVFFVTGGLRETARIADLPVSSHYQWLKGNRDYAKSFEWVKESVADSAEDELHRRGFAGFPKPVIYKGKVTDTYLDYSDTCAVTWLKANRPTKYRDSLVNLTSSAPALINITLGEVPEKPTQPVIEGPDGGDAPIDVNPTISMS